MREMRQGIVFDLQWYPSLVVYSGGGQLHTTRRGVLSSDSLRRDALRNLREQVSLLKLGVFSAGDDEVTSLRLAIWIRGTRQSGPLTKAGLFSEDQGRHITCGASVAMNVGRSMLSGQTCKL